MAGDVQLAALATESAPLDYVVPSSAVVRLKSVHALFDGSGAAGAWLPAIELISDSGHTIALASDQGVSVAAGGSADVSWFPGVKHAQTATPSSGAAPSVATFYRSVFLEGDPPLSVAAGDTVNIEWLHAAIPSDGSITWPPALPAFVEYNIACMGDEALYVGWENGAYEKAAVLGTDSRIVQADQVSPSNYDNRASPLRVDSNDWLWQARPSAHIANDTIHAYVINGDTVSRDVNEAFLVCRLFPTTGYTGGIPGWPA